MRPYVISYFKKILWIGLTLFALLAAASLFLPYKSGIAAVSGYLLSYLFVVSNFWVINKIELDDHKKFLTYFLTSIAVRFILVLGCFILVLAVTEINQIFFTVSFIISYIFHSVIEIIFINKILDNDNRN